jgi:hypothetical protein
VDQRLTRALRIARAMPAFIGRWVLRLGFPLAGAAIMLRQFPYYTDAAGLHLRIQATLFTDRGISADTTIGNWQFPNVDGLPIGLHVTPENVDLLRLSDAANANGSQFTDQLHRDLSDQASTIAWWLAGEALIGILLGLLFAAAVNLAVRYLRGQVRDSEPWRELRHRGLQLATAIVVVALIAGYGWLSYNPRWSKESKLTGTLGAVQLVPDQLAQYYNHQSKAFDVISAISAIQAQLQQQIGSQEVADTAYNIMFISDMHLASTYPLVEQYARNFNVKLIINTGDETEFGTSYDLSESYLDQIRQLTATVPMIWLAGNHDSPVTVATMSTIPGVTVLGAKTYHATGYEVSAQYATADGLLIAGVPDPRVYGASGAYGSDKAKETDPLERNAVDSAVKGASKTMHFDIFGTHEPVAAHQLLKDLPGQIRQVNSGHTHQQNESSQVQPGSTIDLVEGSTGAGGLDNAGSNPPPVEFSIESVAADCQFTKVVRFQLGANDRSAGAAGAGGAGSSGNTVSGPVVSSYGQHVTATTIYFKQQTTDPVRFCSSAVGVSSVHDLGSTGR